MYTDRPRPGAVRVASATPRPAETTARSYAAQQATANQQLAASNQRIEQNQTDTRAAETVAKDLAATRAARCKQAREQYNNAINSRRLYTEDKDGKRTYLSDSELAAERVEAAKQVEAICGPQG
jgi:hypothetical protein